MTTRVLEQGGLARRQIVRARLENGMNAALCFQQPGTKVVATFRLWIED